MTVEDAKPNDKIFVPNCSGSKTIEIFRYLTGKRKDFPCYNEGSNVVVGIQEDAWCKPQIYREAYCPKDMACIVRTKSRANKN